MSKYKINIYEALKKMNQQDICWFEHLTVEEQASLHPYVLLLWVKGAQKNYYVHMLLTNEYVNPFVFSLDQNHRQLLYKLICYANGLDDYSKYYFQKKDQQKKDQKIISYFYNVNKYKANDILTLISQEELEELRELYGQET